MSVAPRNSLWLLSYIWFCADSLHITPLYIQISCFSASEATMEFPFPPPDRRIILVGFLESNNGCSCDLHPFGCVTFLCSKGTTVVLGWSYACTWCCITSWLVTLLPLMDWMVIELDLHPMSTLLGPMVKGLMMRLFDWSMCAQQTMGTGPCAGSSTIILGTLLPKLLSLPTVIIDNLFKKIKCTLFDILPGSLSI